MIDIHVKSILGLAFVGASSLFGVHAFVFALLLVVGFYIGRGLTYGAEKLDRR